MDHRSRVLVHTATGGVGLAAQQVIDSVGATCIGTAGSSSKRAIMRLRGVQHMVDSRSHQFVEECAQMMQGPTAVVNTLTSPGDFRRRGYHQHTPRVVPQPRHLGAWQTTQMCTILDGHAY